MQNEEISKRFDNVAKKYARNSKDIEELIRQRSYEEIKKIIEDYKAKNKKIKILEAGCGNGALTVKLLKHDNVRITAVDFSKGMLRELKRRIDRNYKEKAKKVKKRLKIIKEDLTRLKVEDEPFDLVILINVLINIASKEEVNEILKNLNKVLKKDGHLILSVKNKISLFNLIILMYKKELEFPQVTYSLWDIKRILTNSGMRIIKIVGVRFKENPYKLNLKFNNITKKTKKMIKNKKELVQNIRAVIKTILIGIEMLLRINSDFVIICKKTN